MLSCQEMMRHFNIDPGLMMAIHRIDFEDDRTLNQNDGGENQTYYDHLVIVVARSVKIFFIDMGVGSLPALMISGEKVIDSPIYQSTEFLKRPDEIELLRLVKEIPFDY